MEKRAGVRHGEMLGGCRGFQHGGNKRESEADVEEKKDMSGLQAAILSLRLLSRRKESSFYTRTCSDHIAFIKITKQW